MEREYTYINVSRKIMGMWFNITHVNRYGEDGLAVLHRTRDHYRNQWGFKNVKLILKWNSEELIF